jgi:hypothetical protein
VHWIVPTIAGALLATSLLLIFVGYLNYLVDTYLMYAASAIAANTIARSACGAAAPLLTNQMFEALGVGGGGSLIGGGAPLPADLADELVQVLEAGGAEMLEIDPEDDWLMMALKLDRQKEN